MHYEYYYYDKNDKPSFNLIKAVEIERVLIEVRRLAAKYALTENRCYGQLFVISDGKREKYADIGIDNDGKVRYRRKVLWKLI